MAADRPEKTLGAVKPAEFRRGQQSGFDEVRRALDRMHIFADPVERLEIAKAAFSVLDVRFDHVAAVSDALVSRIALGKLGRDEFGGGPADDLLAEAGKRMVERLGVAP